MTSFLSFHAHCRAPLALLSLVAACGGAAQGASEPESAAALSSPSEGSAPSDEGSANEDAANANAEGQAPAQAEARPPSAEDAGDAPADEPASSDTPPSNGSSSDPSDGATSHAATAAASDGAPADAANADAPNATRSRPSTILAPARPGRIAPARMQRVLQEVRPAVNECYVAALRRSEQSGTLRVRFLVGPRGRVESAEVYESEFSDEALHTCITEAYRTLRFPRPRPRGSSVLATFPYTLATE
ncbi:MAG: AgmX/PglI C-terminal domain-containing protein [Myxococcota bacterium]